MPTSFWLLGGDTRSTWAAKYLAERGFEVHTHGVPDLAEEPLPGTFHTLILPFPSFQGALLKGHSAIPVEELLCRLGSHTQIYGGKMGKWQEAIEKCGGRIIDLYDTEPLTTANAALTAEAAIGLAITHSPLALLESKCLVIGYGRIGKVLARKLQALSAHVTVCARKASDRALAEACGYTSDETGVYQKGFQYDFVFNTVPSLVLDRRQIGFLPDHCLIIELASMPGGMDQKSCGDLKRNYILAAGLPGLFSPANAGALYAQSILDISSKGG